MASLGERFRKKNVNINLKLTCITRPTFDLNDLLRDYLDSKYPAFFDAEFYSRNYVSSSVYEEYSKAHLIDNYIREHVKELRNPSFLFDLTWYRDTYHSGRSNISRVDLLIDFINNIGPKERYPSAFFASDWYYDRHEVVRERIAAGVTTSILEDYLLFGSRAGLRPTPWFDEVWYRKEHPEIIDDIETGKFISGYHHFLTIGQFKGLDPEPRFSSRRYLAMNPDVEEAVRERRMASAFDHYTRYGRLEGRGRGTDPDNLLHTLLGQTYPVMFDADSYLPDHLANIDATERDNAPLLSHYIQENAAGLRDPSVFFDLAWYRNIYLADRYDLSGIDLLLDFFKCAGLKERYPSPFFAPDWYYNRYDIVRKRMAAGTTTSILEDYLLFGGRGGLRPNPWFDEMWYRKEHPEINDDIAANKLVSGFHHFLMIGQVKGFDPDPRFSSRRYLAMNPDVEVAIREGHIVSAYDHFTRHGGAEGRSRGNDIVNGAALNVAL